MTWPTLDAWARHTDRAPDVAEIDALFALDAALRPSAETVTGPDDV